MEENTKEKEVQLQQPVREESKKKAKKTKNEKESKKVVQQGSANTHTQKTEGL